MNLTQRVLLPVLSLAVAIGLWLIASRINPTMFPSPFRVASLSIELVMSPGPDGNTGLFHLWVSLRRVFIIVAISLVISVVVGVLMGLHRPIQAPFAMVLPGWMTVPDIVGILFALILLGYTDLTVIIVVSFLAIPFGIVNVWQGMKNIDTDLLEMANTFQADGRLLWRYIYLPTLLPYLFSSGRYLLGMIWKVVLLAEAFGISNGIGAMVRFWYNQGNIPQLLAYFLLFVATVFVIEYLFLEQLEKRAFAWRPE
jgi:NitT/TauT family transport system permease protein